jgi:hypothetical protein
MNSLSTMASLNFRHSAQSGYSYRVGLEPRIRALSDITRGNRMVWWIFSLQRSNLFESRNNYADSFLASGVRRHMAGRASLNSRIDINFLISIARYLRTSLSAVRMSPTTSARPSITAIRSSRSLLPLKSFLPRLPKASSFEAQKYTGYIRESRIATAISRRFKCFILIYMGLLCT